MLDRSTDSAGPDSFRSFRRDHAYVASERFGLSPQDSAETGPEQMYRELLESTAEGVYGLDERGYVTFVNPAARRMTGWTLEDLRGRTQHSMVHHSYPDGSAYPRDACPIYAALRDGLVHRRSDEVFWRKDGSSFPVAYTSSPIFRDGRPAGAVIIFRELAA